jgi:tRNA dimethylallyltransferase
VRTQHDTHHLPHPTAASAWQITLAERRGIPHHLLDVLDPAQDFSAGDFFVLARRAAEDILQVGAGHLGALPVLLVGACRSWCAASFSVLGRHCYSLLLPLPAALLLQRGKTPIVVGGTGFYLRWFILGKPTTPAASAASEAAAAACLEEAYSAAAAAAGVPLAELGAEERWAAGVALVEALGDAGSAERLRGEPNNQYRMHRVVDILLQSDGRPLAGGWAGGWVDGWCAQLGGRLGCGSALHSVAPVCVPA